MPSGMPFLAHKVGISLIDFGRRGGVISLMRNPRAAPRVGRGVDATLVLHDKCRRIPLAKNPPPQSDNFSITKKPLYDDTDLCHHELSLITHGEAIPSERMLSANEMPPQNFAWDALSWGEGVDKKSNHVPVSSAHQSSGVASNTLFSSSSSSSLRQGCLLMTRRHPLAGAATFSSHQWGCLFINQGTGVTMKG